MFKFNNLSILLAFAVAVGSCAGLRNPLGGYFPTADVANDIIGDDVGEALHVTPLLKSGANGAAVARAAAETHIGNVTSYTGYFTVDEKHDGNMFFWYFPSQDNNPDAPTVVWLQGGPGGSDMFGLFVEIGPFRVTSDGMNLEPNPTTWNKNYSLLFFDNPVGTGFSYVTDPNGYCTNEEEVGADLLSAIQQFYSMFPDVSTNPLYLTGESYAGKYVPAFGYAIHEYNAQARAEGNPTIPLAGLGIGDGWSDPLNMYQQYPEIMFQMGLVSVAEREVVQQYVNNISLALKSGDTYAAFKFWDAMLNGDLTPYPPYFKNVTGSSNYYNILRTGSPVEYSYYPKYLSQAWVRKAIHVGDNVFHNGTTVEMHLAYDFFGTEAKHLGVLCENYKVLIYSGQLDVIIGASLTESYLEVLPWSGQKAYKTSPRYIWRVNPEDEEVAGWAREVNVGKSKNRGFWQVTVRGGGHILPWDQPVRTLDMITRFVNGESFKPQQ